MTCAPNSARWQRNTTCLASALGRLRRTSVAPAILTLGTFISSILSPVVAFAQAAANDSSADPPTQTAPAENTDVAETAETPAPPSTVDTSSSTDAKTDEKTQEELLDHIKEEAGIEEDSSQGTTTSLGISGANVVLPAATTTGVSGKQISIPKGEGTIKGMEESFSAQLSTGIATFSVPFALPAARGKAQPSLGLSYSSSSGLGLAGMGWSIGVPFIARQTDRGLPKYLDQVGFHHEQDRFVFNGGQELVPICTVQPTGTCAGALESLDEVMPDWAAGWQYFRPRVEGSFLRFFWSPTHETWRVQDKNGVTLEFGVPLNDDRYRAAIEVNPGDTRQIYRWHLVRQYDIYGDTQSHDPSPKNGIVYRYSQNGGQAYLTDIFSTPPATNSETAPLAHYAQHVRVSYEQRPDTTQSYRSGWLMEQAQRPVRVDVTSKSFEGSADDERELVRRYHLQYDASSHISLLQSVQVEGRCNDTTKQPTLESAAQQTLPATNCPRLPPMTFEYTRVAGHLADGTTTTSALAGYEPFDERTLSVSQSPPHSLDDVETTLMDVNGDSLSDLLVTAAGVYGGKHAVFVNGGAGIPTGFEQQPMGVQGVLNADANVIKLSNFNVVPLDVNGDGLAHLLHMPRTKTYAIYDPVVSNGAWNWVGRQVTTASNNSPKVDFGNDTTDIKVMDVNFDGLVDVVASQGTEFQTFFALGRYPGGDGQLGNATRTGKKTATISNDPVRMCVPWRGTPLRFSDSDTELADMNGDGITDIVRLKRGDIHYWPGRGNGYWGTGALDGCPEGTFDQDGDLAMEESPYYTDIQGTSLRLDDVNGDGLPDLVQVNFDDVSVWLNVNGTGWTERYIIDGTPASPAFANRVRLTDVNASGTLDILWGDGNAYKYIDLAGGVRPWLLKKASNGLGKTTEIEYKSSAQEMLDAQNAGPDKEWTSKMPTLVQLVKRVTEKDNLTIAGRPPATYVTEYTYKNPVYEGRQREFRGFRDVEAKKIGDSNSPTSITRSVFLLGECKDETDDATVDCDERWLDNPREALKGLPVVTETRDEHRVYLSSNHNTYTLRHLYDGLDGRAVRYAFLSETDNYLYDTADFSASTPDPTPKTVARVEKLSGSEFSSDELDTFDEKLPLPVQSTAGAAHVRSTTRMDGFGNQTLQVAFGVVGEDEEITSTTVPARIDEPSGWLWRTARTYVTGIEHSDQVRNDTHHDYDTNGDLTETTAVLEGTLPLAREQSDQALHPARSTGSQDLLLAANTYDAFGNVLTAKGAGQRASAVGYDETYQQLPIEETIYAGRQDLDDIDADNDGLNPLITTATYDRGLGIVTGAFDVNGQPTQIIYDNFGRLIEMYKAEPGDPITPSETPVVSPKPSVRIQYFLPPPFSGQSYSLVHTEAQDGVDLDDESYQESWAYVDGLGRTIVTLTEAEPDSTDTQSTEQRWIVSNLNEWDQKSAVRRKYLEFFYQGDPMAFNFSNRPTCPYGRQRYDAFGRALQAFDLDGTVTLQSVYHALSTDLWDAADLEPGGTHAGSYASETKDGHGRTIETVERFRVISDSSALMETRYTRTQYLPTGEPEYIRRIRGSNNERTSRWFVYDSLGRMVLNVEPHTSVAYESNDEPNQDFADYAAEYDPEEITAWRYAYNNAGDLVGTSDARGCGSNYFYDAAGRLVGEDYFPCEEHHAAYTEPDVDTGILTGAGLEVFYRYDSAASTSASFPSGRTQNHQLGRLAGVYDQARATVMSYDGRGRIIWTGARIANPGPVNPDLSQRYAPRWYFKDFEYDSADRLLKETTGAQQLLAGNGQSAVIFQYSQRGTMATVRSSYNGSGVDSNDTSHRGEGTQPYLVSEIVRTADNRIEKVEYGDLASTTTTYTYDDRRRMQSVITSRAPPDADDVWPEDFGQQSPDTFQLLLQDEEYTYDVVNNPTEIRDWRTASEWPDGAKPVTKRIDYDDLYRASRISYEYTTGDDTWISPFHAENEAVSTESPIDSRRALPSPHVAFAKRVLWQSYRYDWLGNQDKTEDDAKGFYDRSLGTVTNGAPGSPEREVPYQLNSASQAGPTGGELEAQYDEAGQLTRLKIDRESTGCLPGDASCDQWFEYSWDEVGRLSRARRWDGSLSTIDIEVQIPAADLAYRYDADDNRVLKTATDVEGDQSHAVYVFNSLELRGTEFDGSLAENDYELSTSTEVVYLFANGVRLARVHFEPTMDPAVGTPDVGQGHTRLFFELGDHLGSTSVVLDKGTSELVERSTFQAYGGTESDYRPTRWKNFREDYRFTGKEEDVEVGLQYFGKRYSNPLLGRWISADPLVVHGIDADPNCYAYVRGRALQATDPLGLEDDGYTPTFDFQAEHGGTSQGTGSVLAAAPTGFEQGPCMEKEITLSWSKPELPTPIPKVAQPQRAETPQATISQGRRQGDAFEMKAAASLQDGVILAAPIPKAVAVVGAVLVTAPLIGSGDPNTPGNLTDGQAAASALIGLTLWAQSKLNIETAPSGGGAPTLQWGGATAERMASQAPAVGGGLSASERSALQQVANDFKTQIDVVGSRAAGTGRGVGSSLPVGKGPGTRSDIDLKIDSDVDIATGGGLSDALKNIGPQGLVDVRPRIGTPKPPTIPIKPDK